MKKSKRPSNSSASSHRTNRLSTVEEQAPEDIHGRIAARAYALYQARGFQNGYDLEDWLTAEREVLNGTSQAGRTA